MACRTLRINSSSLTAAQLVSLIPLIATNVNRLTDKENAAIVMNELNALATQ